MCVRTIEFDARDTRRVISKAQISRAQRKISRRAGRMQLDLARLEAVRGLRSQWLALALVQIKPIQADGAV